MNKETSEAFERLIDVARRDTGQSHYVADFILAWWNPASCGGFDISDLFAVDEKIATDMATVFSYVASRKIAEYPDGYRKEIEDVIRRWRPEVWSGR